ncbi:MAG: TnpV protein, partial [Tissierellales bacterium]|nr:TnpV protein [Tissierellales bacterium]
ELYAEMLVRETLYEHIEDIQREAIEMMERLEKQYIERHSLTMDSDFMEMYRIRQQARNYAEEIIKKYLIFYGVN